MVMIGTMPTKRAQYKAKNFVIHARKLLLHQQWGE